MAFMAAFEYGVTTLHMRIFLLYKEKKHFPRSDQILGPLTLSTLFGIFAATWSFLCELYRTVEIWRGRVSRVTMGHEYSAWQ